MADRVCLINPTSLKTGNPRQHKNSSDDQGSKPKTSEVVVFFLNLFHSIFLRTVILCSLYRIHNCFQTMGNHYAHWILTHILKIGRTLLKLLTYLWPSVYTSNVSLIDTIICLSYSDCEGSLSIHKFPFCLSIYSFNKSGLFTFLAYKVAAPNMLSNHKMKKKIYNIEYDIIIK